MSLSGRQIEAMAAVIEIGLGQGAAVLNTMLQSQVALQAPHIQVSELDEYLGQLARLGADRLSAVQLGYQGSFSGSAQLVFPTTGAAELVTMLTGETLDAHDFDLIQAGTLSEVGNIVINGVMGTVSNLLGQHFAYSVPTYLEERADHLITAPDGGKGFTLVVARTRFAMGPRQVEGDLLLIFENGALDTVLEAMGGAISDA